MTKSNEISTKQAPNYTTRMLIDKTSVNVELKKFSHFTLCCTADDESEAISNGFKELQAYLQSNEITFTAEKVVNLGAEEKPLHGVELSFGENESSFRHKLSELFDSLMCPERNGVLYHWEPKDDDVEAKCSHITIGVTPEDKEKADKLVQEGCTFIFKTLDYKQVGPHDPIFSCDLTSAQNASNCKPEESSEEEKPKSNPKPRP